MAMAGVLSAGFSPGRLAVGRVLSPTTIALRKPRLRRGLFEVFDQLPMTISSSHCRFRRSIARPWPQFGGLHNAIDRCVEVHAQSRRRSRGANLVVVPNSGAGCAAVAHPGPGTVPGTMGTLGKTVASDPG